MVFSVLLLMVLIMLLSISQMCVPVLGKDMTEIKSLRDDLINECKTLHQESLLLMDDRINQMEAKINIQNHEIDQLKGQVNRLTKIASHKNQPHRVTRSITKKADDEHVHDSTPTLSTSRLEVSPTHLGSMPYGDYRINIYGHFDNRQVEDNTQKKYYYSPICVLNYESARSSLNYIKNQSEMRFSVEMWNEEVEKEILKYTMALVRHPISVKQIQVLPIEELKLSPDVPHLYTIAKTWIKYQHYPRSVNFTLTCLNQEDCDGLAQQMRSNPHQFHYLKLLVRLNSQTSQQRGVVIKLENLVKGDMVAKLNQRYPEAQTIILTADDQKKLESEFLSNIDVVIFDDFSEGAQITLESEKRVRDILLNLLESSKVSIEEQSEKMWDSVFWNDDNYRPDKTAKTLTEIYNKLDDNQKRNLLKAINDKNLTKGDGFIGLKPLNLGVSLDLTWANERGEKYSQENLTRLIQEAKETVTWEGEKFVPKQMNLSRINLAKLKNKKFFQERLFKISYNTTFISMDVNIKENLGSQFVDEISRVNNQLKDLKESLKRPECYEAGKAPGSCQDLYCIGYKLPGFYFVKGENKMQTVYCDFTQIESSPLDHPEFQTRRIGYASILTEDVYFYVQRNISFSAADSVIPFHLERLNVGGAMDLSKGVFTAPRNGTYHFSFAGMKEYPVVILNIQLLLNEAVVGTTSGGGLNGFLTLVLESTLKLAEGDRVSLKKVGGGALQDNENHYTHFTGRMLEEDLYLP